MTKPIAFASVKYKRPGQTKSTRTLLKYLQHRDGSVRRAAYRSGEYERWQDIPKDLRDDQMSPPEHRSTSWVDRGLGDDYKTILQQLDDWQGRKILTRHWVLSPDPELMAHIPEDHRLDVIARITDNTVREWYRNNGWGEPAYSYVVHQAETTQNGTTLPRPHSHIVTPGTYDLGPHGRPDHYVTRAHIRDLHQTTQQQFQAEMERILGRERAREIIAARNARVAQEQARRYREHQRGFASVMNRYMDARRLLADISHDRKERKRRRQERNQVTFTHLRIYGDIQRERRYREEQPHRQAAWEAAHQSELEEQRRRTHDHQARIARRGTVIPSFKERLERLESRQHRTRARELSDDIINEPPELTALIRSTEHFRRHRRDRDRND